MTTCRDCGRQWTGLSEAHCTACHAHFTSDSGFDTHLAPVRSEDDCYPPGTFKRGDGSGVFETVERKHGSTWRIASTGTHPYAVSHLYQDATAG